MSNAVAFSDVKPGLWVQANDGNPQLVLTGRIRGGRIEALDDTNASWWLLPTEIRFTDSSTLELRTAQETKDHERVEAARCRRPWTGTLVLPRAAEVAP